MDQRAYDAAGRVLRSGVIGVVENSGLLPVKFVAFELVPNLMSMRHFAERNYTNLGGDQQYLSVSNYL